MEKGKVPPMALFRLKIALPNRPGSLGTIASAIGGVKIISVTPVV